MHCDCVICIFFFFASTKYLVIYLANFALRSENKRSKFQVNTDSCKNGAQDGCFCSMGPRCVVTLRTAAQRNVTESILMILRHDTVGEGQL